MKRRVDFADLTLQDIADFGSALGLRFDVKATPIEAERWRAIEDVLNAAEGWHANRRAGSRALDDAMTTLLHMYDVSKGHDA